VRQGEINRGLNLPQREGLLSVVLERVGFVASAGLGDSVFRKFSRGLEGRLVDETQDRASREGAQKGQSG
jgi:hypothetical protein